VIGQHLGQPPLVVPPDRGRAEPLPQLAQHARGIRPAAVGLVDEDQRRDREPPQRAHQHARLRLHALDRADDEHRPVEHAQHPLDLGDEVGVTGGVDQVDGDVAGDERDDRGLDRDAARPLQGQRVRLCIAVVDGAELVDDA